MINKIDTSKLILTRVEVSKMLNLSFPTLLKLSKSGKLPSYKLGRKIFYKYSDIENSLTYEPDQHNI